MSLIPQFGFLELILVAIVALIVVGPRDLPKLMRSAGRMVAKARAMAAEFTSAFDEMARESEMEELRKELDALKNNNPIAETKRELDEAVKPIKEGLHAEESAVKKAAANSDAGRTDAAQADTEPADRPAPKADAEAGKP